jgi:aminoglycoside phosphotransferase family enzyme/predicted kinase
MPLPMSEPAPPAAQEALIHAIAAALRRHGETVELIETHISWVLVAGAHAYKFKKSLRFDFLDFSTLEARRFYCLEELRLNRRLAPALYLDMVTVRGSASRPRFGGNGPALEYAVHMRAFPQAALWSRRIDAGQLGAAEVDQLAGILAGFHRRADPAPAGSAWGTPRALRRVADDNLALLGALAGGAADLAGVAAVRDWQRRQHARLYGAFLRRKAEGRVRACHGDLHSANITTVGGHVEVFDCIEFNDSLRWTDVLNDLAFICMDLQAHGLGGLAARLLNGYLERGGDYEGLAVLRYYQVECALVRWKVASLPQGGAGPDGAGAARYRRFALQSLRPGPAALLILHGVSGSGKSTLARSLVELLGAVQVRADVERKRLHGLDPCLPAAAGVDAGLYAPAATRATYARLRLLAAAVVRAGLPALVDATFLRRQQRQLFRTLADALGVPFFIVDLRAGEATLRARVAARAEAGGDPSDAGAAVLARQLAQREPLGEDEAAVALALDTEAELNEEALRALCRPVLAALQP